MDRCPVCMYPGMKIRNGRLVCDWCGWAQESFTQKKEEEDTGFKDYSELLK